MDATTAMPDVSADAPADEPRVPLVVSGVADDILPDSRCREAKGNYIVEGVRYEPVFCANCHKFGGGVPQEHITFVMYLCNDCVEKWGSVAGLQKVPDDVFFERVRQHMLEAFGRPLTPDETVIVLDDVNDPLNKLAREAPKGR